MILFFFFLKKHISLVEISTNETEKSFFFFFFFRKNFQKPYSFTSRRCFNFNFTDREREREKEMKSQNFPNNYVYFGESSSSFHGFDLVKRDRGPDKISLVLAC